MAKPILIRRGHPLANDKGVVKASRYVLYEKLGGEAGECHWCGCELTWLTLCADHLDSDIKNNVPENLVGACRGCNANREDGTGQGRKQPKPCASCGTLFISKHHHATAQFCGLSCAGRATARPKNYVHGTRTAYNYGCRCDPCRAENTRAWREWERKQKLLELTI